MGIFDFLRIKNFFNFKFILIFSLLNVITGKIYAENPLYLGMSKSEFEICKALGKQVMAAQSVKPDSPNHKKVYKAWDDNCGMEIMLPLAIKHKINMKDIPSSPLDWANTK